MLAIPSCIGLEFAVAEGIRGVTDDEWTDYNNMFSRSVRHLNFDLVHGPSGSARIPVQNLKRIRSIKRICIPFATVFNVSLEEGIVPLEWKEANIIPLFKKSDFNIGD